MFSIHLRSSFPKKNEKPRMPKDTRGFLIVTYPWAFSLRSLPEPISTKRARHINA